MPFCWNAVASLELSQYFISKGIIKTCFFDRKKMAIPRSNLPTSKVAPKAKADPKSKARPVPPKRKGGADAKAEPKSTAKKAKK